MEVHLEFDSTYGILRAQLSGIFDSDEYREALSKITSGVHYPATISTIWDLRKLDFADIDSKLAHYVKQIRSSFKLRANAKIAYVVSSQLGYGLMRMFQVLTETEEYSLVFYEYDEAEKWIRDVAQPLAATARAGRV